jgi:hypothetical protein
MSDITQDAAETATDKITQDAAETATHNITQDAAETATDNITQDAAETATSNICTISKHQTKNKRHTHTFSTQQAILTTSYALRTSRSQKTQRDFPDTLD